MEPSLRYEERRVYRGDRRAIGEVSLANGQKRAVFELRADRDTLTWWRRIRGGRRVYLLGRKKDGSMKASRIASWTSVGHEPADLITARPLRTPHDMSARSARLAVLCPASAIASFRVQLQKSGGPNSGHSRLKIRRLTRRDAPQAAS